MFDAASERARSVKLMTSRERIRAIIAGRPGDRCGLWLGKLHATSWPALHEYFGAHENEEPIWGPSPFTPVYPQSQGKRLFWRGAEEKTLRVHIPPDSV